MVISHLEVGCKDAFLEIKCWAWQDFLLCPPRTTGNFLVLPTLAYMCANPFGKGRSLVPSGIISLSWCDDMSWKAFCLAFEAGASRWPDAYPPTAHLTFRSKDIAKFVMPCSLLAWMQRQGASRWCVLPFGSFLRHCFTHLDHRGYQTL